MNKLIRLNQKLDRIIQFAPSGDYLKAVRDVAKGVRQRPASHVAAAKEFMKDRGISRTLVQATQDIASGKRARPASHVAAAKQWLKENGYA
tara:strand:- start:3561 stop:3833 length:273 start_codon:yes stop_codon:yes gene_type:complete